MAVGGATERSSDSGFVTADILRETILITGFVLAMMLVVEFLNVVLHGGSWLTGLKGGWRQYVVAGILGALPGCLGSWAVVTLYAHGLVSVGAVVTTMIATSGDESFFMLAVMPRQALWLFLALAVLGIASGVLTDFALRGRVLQGLECHHLAYHPEDAARMFESGFLRRQWRRPTLLRLGLVIGFLSAAAGLATGLFGPEEWNWIRVTALLTSASALAIVAMVPDHFLNDHLWGHVLRKHAGRLFLWVLGALVVARLVSDFFELHTLTPEGRWTMLIIACLVGIIPQSGPHMVFVALFVKGTIPISVLLANSVVQDGHGMLPLLGESRRAFVVVKAINLAVGLLVGAAAMGLGY